MSVQNGSNQQNPALIVLALPQKLSKLENREKKQFFTAHRNAANNNLIGFKKTGKKSNNRNKETNKNNEKRINKIIKIISFHIKKNRTARD